MIFLGSESEPHHIGQRCDLNMTLWKRPKGGVARLMRQLNQGAQLQVLCAFQCRQCKSKRATHRHTRAHKEREGWGAGDEGQEKPEFRHSRQQVSRMLYMYRPAPVRMKELTDDALARQRHGPLLVLTEIPNIMLFGHFDSQTTGAESVRAHRDQLFPHPKGTIRSVYCLV